jgi:glycosyltransferase involved in cell wall biosynthesis
MPKLFIITINYNNLGGLQRTLESVINQNGFASKQSKFEARY